VFGGTLLHELAHARSGAGDVTREFELALTEVMGRMATKVLLFDGFAALSSSTINTVGAAHRGRAESENPPVPSAEDVEATD